MLAKGRLIAELILLAAQFAAMVIEILSSLPFSIGLAVTSLVVGMIFRVEPQFLRLALYVVSLSSLIYHLAYVAKLPLVMFLDDGWP